MPSGPCGPRKGVWNLSSEGPLTGSDMVGVCLDRPSDLKYCRGVMAGRLRGWKDERLPGQLYQGLRLTTLTGL